MTVARALKYSEAIREALDIALGRDPAVYVMGLGVPDPKGIFGTTLGLREKHGPERVFDMPTAENGMTGVAIGSALAGLRPVMVHQRADFTLLAMDQIVNQAAKWRYMFGGKRSVPLVIRIVVGRGWGQGPQHSQSLQAFFAHVPGLKVVLPATPHDAKGLLLAAIEDDSPVVFMEHRWLHPLVGPVPEGYYTEPLGLPRTVREGRDITIAAISYMTVEALRAAHELAEEGIEAEVVDLRTLNPLDDAPILASVRKTGRLIAADTAWTTGGFAGEIVARAAEKALGALKCPPRRIALPDCPIPSTPALADLAYPCAGDIAAAAREMMGRPSEAASRPRTPLDVPDLAFSGPF